MSYTYMFTIVHVLYKEIRIHITYNPFNLYFIFHTRADSFDMSDSELALPTSSTHIFCMTVFI